MAQDFTSEPGRWLVVRADGSRLYCASPQELDVLTGQAETMGLAYAVYDRVELIGSDGRSVS